MSTFGPKDADAWYERNKHKLGDVENDPVLRTMEACLKLGDIEMVAEIGCADGWRLKHLKRKYACCAFGVEPSPRAIRHQTYDVPIYHGYAESLGLHFNYNLIIYGFCLYLVEPSAFFHVLSGADDRLKDGGYIVIHDFLPEHPYSRIFEHNKDLRSRKMDHAQLWLAHPAYSMVRRDIYGDGDDRTHVTILKKDMTNAFPLMEG